jgi:methionyl-tRNA formyltransferase
MTILIATIKEWNIKNFFVLKEKFPAFKWELITSKEELNYKNIKSINPDIIFFPHWSWQIPKEIYSNFECILFHMTDLPFGRGGSPLQNLIIRKIYNTKISAIKVVETLDAGEIYMKKDLDISLGSAEEIYIRMSEIIFFEMIPYLIKNFKKIEPLPQKGNIVVFKRRNPEESELKEFTTLREYYDFIRMLDAKGYPKAFIKKGNFIIKFKDVKLKNDKVIGRFEIEEDFNNSCSS